MKSKDTNARHHRTDYLELTVDDLSAAKAFYTAVFGWQFTDYGPGYAGFSRDGEREMGGLQQGKTAYVEGSPLMVLFSSDLDATESAVQTAGGTITTPTFEFPGGRRFHFQDPAGNILAVWTQPA